MGITHSKNFVYAILSSLGLLVNALADDGSAHVLQSNSKWSDVLPAQCLKGVGAWSTSNTYFATGQSIAVDSLGQVKGREKEEMIAQEDAKHRILLLAAATQVSKFDEEFFIVEGKMKNSEVAAVYRLPPKDSLYVVLTVPKEDMTVKTTLNTTRARDRARLLFAAGSFADAARIFSKLTELGAQDADTVAFAKAASAEVNLQAGAQGEARREALKFLGEFHQGHDNPEAALKAYHRLYQDETDPERELLEKLAALAEATHRPNNAETFRKEITRRWPPKSKP